MRNVMLAAASAAVMMLAGTNLALADGWADSTAYRELSWSGSTGSVARRAARNDDDDETPRKAAPRPRKTVQAEVQADDEDRPQRRNRTARANRGAVGGGSVASSESGGSTGMASFYWQPQRVASGGWFNPNAMTAAHKTLPFGTRVRVTHMGNGQSVEVTINDRGPYIAGRIIDLSRAAASAINMTGQGVARVRMTVLGR